MIGATKRLLIETLLELALGEKIETDGEDLKDYIRALFLLVSSHSIVDLPHAERIGYELVEDYETGIPQHIGGLTIDSSGMLISDVVKNLLLLTKVPDELSELTPELTYEDFQATLYAIDCILVSLQWNESMEPYEKRHFPEKAKKQIISSLRALRNYRRTGEP